MLIYLSGKTTKLSSWFAPFHMWHLTDYFLAQIVTRAFNTTFYSSICSVVVVGFIGKITLQIPFYRPHSEPWVISMSQLNLIIGPARPQEFDEEKEKEAEHERKKQLLKALEDKWKVGGKLARPVI